MAQSIAKGDLALTIDERELEASLRFSPDPNGAEWSAEKVLRILMDARLGSLGPKRAEDLVQKFSRAKGPIVEIVAAGQPAEQPVPELPEWCELVPPPELASIVDSIVSSTPPPELFKVSYESVKIEKTVKKPAPLPFLPPKIEKVTVVEKREKRERVYPDPAIVRSGYARKGERIGILSVAKAGKAGKTIFGKPLPFAAEDGTFLLGAGVVRNKNELLAGEDGAVRIGERWVDVVGIRPHRWTVEPSSDGTTFFLNYAPGDPRLARPTGQEILSKAIELGAAEESLVGADEVGAVIDEAAGTGEAVFSRSVSKDRDASVEVKVSPDKLSAALTILKGRGRGRPLELSAVSAALKASGVRGYKADQLKKDVLEFYKGPKAELVDYPLAAGKAPDRGKDRSLAFALTFLPEDKAAPLRDAIAGHPAAAKTLSQLDEFPVAEATRVAQVQLGQRIGELPPPSQGQGGVDVLGKAIPALPGNDPIIRVYENIDFTKGVMTSTAAGVLLAGEIEGTWKLRVARFRDSSIEVSIAPDSMSAMLSLTAEEGLGSPLSIERVIAELGAKGVVQGVEPFSIAEAVADARAGSPVLRRVVARGVSPLPAGGVKVEWLVRKASGALYKLEEGGRADFKERDTMTRIEAGQPILRVETTGGSGQDGIDVFGKPVKPPAAAGGIKPPEHDDTVREETGTDGAVTFVAKTGGEVVVEGSRISVRERLALQGDLGPESGNIRFPGAVQVAGSVLAGYSLVAGGDVAVAGAIEASLVSSDGSIRVAEGIKGAKRGTIRARSGIEAAFAEQALLLAVDDIKVKNACILCKVKTNGRLVLSTDKGALIGGLCRARKGVDVGVAGSENFTKTEICFGQDYLVADQIEAEEREIEKLKALIVKADRAMADLEAAGASLDQIRQEKVRAVKLLEKRTLRVFDLREKFEEHVPSEVRIRGTVYPGVILESHNRFYEVRTKKSKVAFTFDPKLGRITERPL